jgi:hypothetical protein
VRRLADRAGTDRTALDAVLDAGLVCHLALVLDGSPVVLPTGYGRDGDVLYLHGSTGARSIREAANGIDVRVAVTLLDGIVYARSVFHHSMNYRSAMIYGTARMLTDEAERLAALEIIVEHMIPGRWDATRAPNRKEMAATAVLALPLAEASVKIRTGPPGDEDEDYALDVWAGVVPVRIEYGKPEPDSLLPDTIEVPEHIVRLGAEGPAA